MRPRISIRGCVRWSIGPSVGPLVRPLVRWSVRDDRVKKWKDELFRYFLCKFECRVGVWVWMGVGCPCPTVRNDIVAPRHLFNFFPNHGGFCWSVCQHSWAWKWILHVRRCALEDMNHFWPLSKNVHHYSHLTDPRYGKRGWKILTKEITFNFE